MNAPVSFRLGYVPGVTPGKWARMWADRRPDVPLDLVAASTDEAVEQVRAGTLDAGLVRLPIDRTGLHAIPLYTETTVVLVPKDHLLTAAEETTVAELADAVVLRPTDDPLVWRDTGPGQPAAYEPPTTTEAVELVAAGVGLLVLPQSLARLHHRRDLTYRPLTDAPTSSVVLTWPDAENSDLMEEFIGIVRGRTVNSTRTPAQRAEPTKRDARPAKKTPARRTPARRGTRRR
ncbi:MAG: LysR family transcriptional regulator [Pseudonocardia sp. SCN 72-86]|nr:MAG: LysR family transcriptional regulator [Pseudonocardia sp. SCN 72-86]